MAEARSAVAELRMRGMEERKPSWRDIMGSVRKAVVRNYYRTRNSIRNGVWPTSPSYLGTFCSVIFILLLSEPAATDSFNRWLWRVEEWLYLSQGIPRLLRALLVSFVIGVTFFGTLTVVRIYLLRILLSYRGWMYEPLRGPAIKTICWSILVRLVSGYQPSLYSCQRSLPKMPVPHLGDTISKLLESLQPLCSQEELKEITDLSKVSVKARAAVMIYNCLGFKRMVDREELLPLVIRKTIPICMSQYERIFSTTRIPGEENDELLHFDSKNSKYIIVMSHGIMYKLNVLDSKGQLLFPCTLEEQLEWIVKDSSEQEGQLVPEEAFLPALTSLERSEWARTRKQFFSRGMNKYSLSILERAILCVTLTDFSPKTLTEKGKYLLHGDGTCIWFDKSISLIFFGDGQAGLNCEHSLADAPALGHMWEYAISKDILEKLYTEDGHAMPMSKNFRQGQFRKPRRILWEMSAALATKVQNAVKFAKTNIADLDLKVSDHDTWGKGLIKKCKVSPDAFVQMAIQLAYFRESGKFAQTYEASMTRLYLNGRTETVRSCSQEMATFIRAVEDKQVNNEEKRRLLKIVAEKHQSLYRDAMNGKGIDRHLFALFVACLGLGQDSKFLKKVLSRPWTLSTSQQPQQQQANVPDCNLPVFRPMLCPGGGFGPVSDDGYGVSYMLSSDDKLFFHVSSKHSANSSDSSKFSDRIFESLETLLKIFDL